MSKMVKKIIAFCLSPVVFESLVFSFALAHCPVHCRDFLVPGFSDFFLTDLSHVPTERFVAMALCLLSGVHGLVELWSSPFDSLMNRIISFLKRFGSWVVLRFSRESK